MSPPTWRRIPPAFSLIELMVAMVVMAMLLGILVQIIDRSSSQWRRVSDKGQAFESARVAFETLTRTLSQATLNTEYDYFDASRQARNEVVANSGSLQNFVPDVYGRFSSLHFVNGKSLLRNQHGHAIFFQAPLNFSDPEKKLAGMLNAIGFFVEFASDLADRPPNVVSSLPARNRFRLMQYLQPTQHLDTYRTLAGDAWITNDLEAVPPRNVHLLAENVLIFAVLPKLPDEEGKPNDFLAADYEYDSRTPWSSAQQPLQMHQLPPIVRVLLVAVDESTAARNNALGEDFRSYYAGEKWFQDPQKYLEDLKEVEKYLQEQGANYRIFQTDIPIRASKWSL